jgi:hypothetical protein
MKKSSLQPLWQAAQIIVGIISLKLMYDAMLENKSIKRSMREWDK